MRNDANKSVAQPAGVDMMGASTQQRKETQMTAHCFAIGDFVTIPATNDAGRVIARDGDCYAVETDARDEVLWFGADELATEA